MPDATTVDDFLAAAVAAYRAGKFGEADALCHTILKQQPDHVASLQILAAIAGQSGAPRRGIELVHRVIALRPEMGDAYIQLAQLLRLDDRVAEAIAALKKAIDLEPGSAAAYNDLGLIHLGETAISAAIECFDRAIMINPRLAIAHYNKGMALEWRGLRSEAAASFRQVVAIDPEIAEAHAKLGNLLWADEHHAEAVACFRRAIASKPDSGVAMMCQAKILVEEGKAAEAEASARRAIEHDGTNSDAYCLLGSILSELGRFDDAAAAFDLGLALNRQQTSAYYELVHVRKMTQRDRPLLRQMEWILKEHDVAEARRVDLHFALGKAYDDLGDYENAICNVDAGNRLKHRQMAYDRAAHAATVESLIATFTADFFSRNIALGCDCEVPIFIVGMPRSGTTLVEQILSSHRDVAAGGELAFWSERTAGFRMNAAGDVDPTWVNATVRDYNALLGAMSPVARRVTDKAPQNFNFIASIHLAFPRARIIHCRRHPVDTCLSIYFQNFAQRMDFSYDRSDLRDYYRQYIRLMDHWRSVLPHDCMLDVHYEELISNREAVTRKMLAFCGLEWDEMCLHSERNPRPVRTASLWQARQPIYTTSVARWRHYGAWLGTLSDLFDDSI